MILMDEILNESNSLLDKKKSRNLKWSLLKQNEEPVLVCFAFWPYWPYLWNTTQVGNN